MPTNCQLSCLVTQQMEYDIDWDARRCPEHGAYWYDEAWNINLPYIITEPRALWGVLVPADGWGERD